MRTIQLGILWWIWNETNRRNFQNNCIKGICSVVSRLCCPLFSGLSCQRGLVSLQQKTRKDWMLLYGGRYLQGQHNYLGFYEHPSLDQIGPLFLLVGVHIFIFLYRKILYSISVIYNKSLDLKKVVFGCIYIGQIISHTIRMVHGLHMRSPI